MDNQPHDCKRPVCDGNGGTTDAVNTDDRPVSTECHYDYCTDQGATAEANVMGGCATGTCEGGACKEKTCNSPVDCQLALPNIAEYCWEQDPACSGDGLCSYKSKPVWTACAGKDRFCNGAGVCVPRCGLGMPCALGECRGGLCLVNP
jgi:hypothetical protein